MKQIQYRIFILFFHMSDSDLPFRLLRKDYLHLENSSPELLRKNQHESMPRYFTCFLLFDGTVYLTLYKCILQEQIDNG